MRKNKRELATECNREEVDHNMIDIDKAQGHSKQLDDVSTDEVRCGNAQFIYEGDVVMIGYEGKELTFDMS